MAFENVGHTIQKMINNTPVSVAANAFTTTVATTGGDIYMAGFINNKIQPCFEDIIFNNDVVGKVIETKASDHSIWLLNDEGSVYEFNFNKGECEKQFNEIYRPRDCCGDKAIRIAAGRDHVLILTNKNRVFGAGDNSEYQLVPQGKSRYECATEIIITDTLLHDDCCCDQFSGFLNQPTKPVIPSQDCTKPVCFSHTINCAQFGYLTLGTSPAVSTAPYLSYTSTNGTVTLGTLYIPLFISLTITGFGCLDSCGNLSGTVTVTVTAITFGGCTCPITGMTLDGANNGFISSSATPSVATNVPVSLILANVATNILVTPLVFTFPLPACLTCSDKESASLDLTINITPVSGANPTVTATVNNITSAPLNLATITFGSAGTQPAITYTINGVSTFYSFGVTTGSLIAVLPSGVTSAPTSYYAPLPYPIPVSCCTLDKGGENSNCCNKEFKDCCPIPQPCWKEVYAGFNISVIVDSSNRIYVLGSLYQIRSNKHLLRKNRLEELLDRTTATISLPADELNCCMRPKNGNCRCNKCKDKCFKTDLSRFGVQLSFNNGYCVENGEDCAECPNGGTVIRNLKNKNSVCDFLKALQNSNEYPNCENTCLPCDNTVYLNVCGGNCGCTCGNVFIKSIKSITLYNKKSTCKYISRGGSSCVNYNGGPCGNEMTKTNFPPSVVCKVNKTHVKVDLFSLIEFDLNKYSINNNDYPLDDIIVLDFGTKSTVNVDLFVDTCRPGAIKLVSCDVYCPGPEYDDDRRDAKRYNVDFPIDLKGTTATKTKFALNYGSILDSVDLTNFKLAVGLGCGFPCVCYRNPPASKLVLAYLRGGDRVRFVEANTTKNACQYGVQSSRFPVTPDVPTIFNFRRRVLDVGVGNNNLSVLVGGVACPNEVYALGENCYGELGINGLTGITSNETVLCFRKLNRCLFDCQVEKIFSGNHVTFYITQSYRVYTSGQWKCVCSSNIPICLPAVCQAWKIVEIGIAKNHVILLGKDGCIFGFGDNNLGELGLKHLECVKRPTALSFFTKYNQCFARRFAENIKHPLIKNWERHCNVCFCDPCKCQPCTPCESFCEREPCRRKCNKCRFDPCKCRKNGLEYFRSDEYFGCRSCKSDPCRCDNYVSYEKKKYIANDRCSRRC